MPVGLHRRPSHLYVVFLGLMTLFSFLSWPVMALDTDLWYHLDAGRRLLTTLRIPAGTYFSFLEPPRFWADYFWLFRVLVYAVHAAGGYVGLIVLRSVLFAGAFTLVARYLRRGELEHGAWAWSAGIFVLLWAVLLERYLNVRPHMVSYLLILAFLFVLEHAPRRAWWLLPLGVAWSNVHGITYPVMLLITGAYAIEHLIRRARTGERDSARIMREFVPAVLVMLTIYLTPHGMSLIPVPWQPLGYAGQTIRELQPVAAEHLLSLSVVRLAPSRQTLFAALFALSLLSGLTALARGRMRVSHLILWLGGGFLLMHGVRFMSEYALLCLPVLARHPVWSPGSLRRGMSGPVYALLMAVLMVMPYRYWQTHFHTRLRFPLSSQFLPEGVAAFLRHADTGGSVLNHPNRGGYLRWALGPRFRIFMDMEVPFLFTSEDLLTAQKVFSEPAVLSRMLETYAPDYITVPREAEKFPELIKAFPQYVPVFFDKEEVVYADGGRHPALVEAFDLRSLEPFALGEDTLKTTMEEAEPGVWLPALGAMLAVAPEEPFLNRLAGILLLDGGEADRALERADRAIRQSPERPNAYELRGAALLRLGEPGLAERAFRNALKRTKDPDDRIALLKAVGRAALEGGAPERAYRALSRAVDVFAARTTVEELMDLGRAARLAGHRDVARAVFRYLAEFRLGPEPSAERESLERELGALKERPERGGGS
ncbi:MAG TPA: hypothetical protein VGB20_03920 [bacterium]